MTIHSLRINDFRNLAAVDFSPHPSGFNIISGENGSGKTNLLEAIYYLGLGRSFRHAPHHSLVQHSKQVFSLFAHLSSHLSIGMQKGLSGALRLQMGENVVSISELAAYLPIQVMHPQSHHFFELGPVFRRKYLDWGLFYHYSAFLPCWHHYMRMLRQRNAAIRRHRSKQEIDVWTQELLKYGETFHDWRRTYVDDITPYILAAASELLPAFPLQIHYHPGWEEKSSLAEALSQSYAEEMRMGHTQYGPHRADLTFSIHDLPARHVLSRGQQKLLICAIMVAQGMLLTKQAKTGPIYLIDDLPAELDEQSRIKLLGLLSKQHAQVFISAIESHIVNDVMKSYFNETPTKVFHVEHGKLIDSLMSPQKRCDIHN